MMNQSSEHTLFKMVMCSLPITLKWIESIILFMNMFGLKHLVMSKRQSERSAKFVSNSEWIKLNNFFCCCEKGNKKYMKKGTFLLFLQRFDCIGPLESWNYCNTEYCKQLNTEYYYYPFNIIVLLYHDRHYFTSPMNRNSEWNFLFFVSLFSL